MLQTECEVSFCRDFEFFAARESLRAGTGGTTREGTNGGTFASASNSSDEGSGSSASADVLAGSLILADAVFLISCRDVFTFYRVANTVNSDGAEIDGEAICIAYGGELCVRTSRDEYVSVGTDNVFTHGASVQVRGVGILHIGVDRFVCTDSDLSSPWDCVPLRNESGGWSEQGEQERERKIFHEHLAGFGQYLAG